jgi:hypothetical protein
MTIKTEKTETRLFIIREADSIIDQAEKRVA